MEETNHRKISMKTGSARLLLHYPYLLFGSFALLITTCLFVFAKSTKAQKPEVVDIALESGFQDAWFGHFKRGRAMVAADFDLDGRVDFYVGNPGDESFVIRNTTELDGKVHFEMVQVLLKGEVAWGASAADYDNDGDYDLFITLGGNESTGYNHLFKNLWMESGMSQLCFIDVTDTAGLRGPVLPDFESPPPLASAGAVWGDYDRDGDVDLFVNVRAVNSLVDPNSEPASPLLLRNILWRNDGDGTFTDVTDEVGLGVSLRQTQHSTFLDIDNDGDLDLFENNLGDRNVLWRNRLMESGTASFEDVTREFSNPPSDNLSYPIWSFASTAADFNNDGWQDLIVFVNGNRTELLSPYRLGHAFFLNQRGKGFVNVAEKAAINNPYQKKRGTMGCQVGDLNDDGIPDVYMGNGGPWLGQVDQLYLSNSKVSEIPHYVNMSHLIDFPAPKDPSLVGKYPPYPYRSHAVSFADVDGDGLLEIAVASGGPARWPDSAREPNRLFKFVNRDKRPNYFKVRPIGNGTTVSSDAIGTRFALTVSQGGGAPWKIYNTLLGGSCFSAQNGFEVHFGLKDADAIHSLEVIWPDGFRETITEGLSVNSSVVIVRGA